MDGFQSPLLDSSLLGAASSGKNTGVDGYEKGPSRGFPTVKKRGHGSRPWIRIYQDGTSDTLELDKATLMKHCSLPARDLRLLDPMFIYPSTILGREKAIVISLEQIRCIITADEVLVMKSLDGCVVQYHSELIKRIQTNKDQAGKHCFTLLPFLVLIVSTSEFG